MHQDKSSIRQTLRCAKRFSFSCFISWNPISVRARLNTFYSLEKFHTKMLPNSDETAATLSLTFVTNVLAAWWLLSPTF